MGSRSGWALPKLHLAALWHLCPLPACCLPWMLVSGTAGGVDRTAQFCPVPAQPLAWQRAHQPGTAALESWFGVFKLKKKMVQVC